VALNTYGLCILCIILWKQQKNTCYLSLKKVSHRFISTSMNNLYGILCISMSVLLEYKLVKRFGAPNSVALPLNYRNGLERTCQCKVICQVFFYIKSRLAFSQRGLELSWHWSCEYLFNIGMLLLLFPLKWALINIK
jgi:hypothetical protein